MNKRYCNTKFFFTLLTLSLIGLSGCQTSQNINQEVLSDAPLQILAQKSQDALLASTSLKNARLENLKQIQIKQTKIDTDIMTVDYIGTPEMLLNSIANQFGYRYLESGSHRQLPIVNFTNRKETGLEMVKDVAVFLDGYANINVDVQNKTILLTYLVQQ